MQKMEKNSVCEIIFHRVVISENERKLLVKKLVENDYFFYIKFRAGFFAARFKLVVLFICLFIFVFMQNAYILYVFKSEPAV